MELKHFELKVQIFLKEFRVMSNVVLDGVAEAIDEEDSRRKLLLEALWEARSSKASGAQSWLLISLSLEVVVESLSALSLPFSV